MCTTHMHGQGALLLMVNLNWMVMSQGGDVFNACLAPDGCYSGMSIQKVHCCVALQAQHVIKQEPAHGQEFRGRI